MNIARRKIHFAPLVAQERQIRRLLREGRYRDVTHLLRCAIDCYLGLGKPGLAVQARQMAEDFQRAGDASPDDPSRLQDASRDDSERW